MANEGLGWDPLLKNVIILLVTVTGRGDNPMYGSIVGSSGV